MITEEKETIETEIESDDTPSRFNTLTDDGEKTNCSISSWLKENLIQVQKAVLKKNWDFISVVAGIPGVGKSCFAQRVCKFLDPTFTTKDRICFSGSGKNGLIERTTNAKKGQAFMLDESFSDLNTRVTRSPEFVAIINHLQLIRQKGLFIILILPNFFDLSKSMAVFRTTLLMVIIRDENWGRGAFAMYGRSKKKALYVDGNRYMDYDAVKPDWISSFSGKWIADKDLYEKLKEQHLIDQAKLVNKERDTKVRTTRDKLVFHVVEEMGITPKKISEITDLTTRSIYDILKKMKSYKIEDTTLKYKPTTEKKQTKVR